MALSDCGWGHPEGGKVAATAEGGKVAATAEGGKVAAAARVSRAGESSSMPVSVYGL